MDIGSTIGTTEARVAGRATVNSIFQNPELLIIRHHMHEHDDVRRAVYQIRYNIVPGIR